MAESSPRAERSRRRAEVLTPGGTIDLTESPPRKQLKSTRHGVADAAPAGGAAARGPAAGPAAAAAAAEAPTGRVRYLERVTELQLIPQVEGIIRRLQPPGSQLDNDRLSQAVESVMAVSTKITATTQIPNKLKQLPPDKLKNLLLHLRPQYKDNLKDVAKIYAQVADLSMWFVQSEGVDLLRLSGFEVPPASVGSPSVVPSWRRLEPSLTGRVAANALLAGSRCSFCSAPLAFRRCQPSVSNPRGMLVIKCEDGEVKFRNQGNRHTCFVLAQSQDE